MKFLRILIVLSAITLSISSGLRRSVQVTARPLNNCKVTLIDNDDASTQENFSFFGDTTVPKLNCDLSQDVHSVLIENLLPLNYQNACKYEFKACKGENYKDCGPAHTGLVKPGEKSIIVSEIIHKMKSFKIKNSVAPLKTNNECWIKLIDNDFGIAKQSKEIGHGKGSKSSLSNDLDNDVAEIVVLNKNQSESCTCKISTFHNVNYKGSTFSHTVQAKPTQQASWKQRKNETWKKNLSSIQYDCNVLKEGLLDYFD